MDYTDIKSAVQPIIDDLDHAHLGAWSTPKVVIDFGSCEGTKTVPWLEGDGSDKFNPTSENLLFEIAKQLVKRSFVFSALSLEETCTCSCTLTWEEFSGLTPKQTQP
jgi:6-pyruvoyl-tetrahydropterin synthase